MLAEEAKDDQWSGTPALRRSAMELLLCCVKLLQRRPVGP